MYVEILKGISVRYIFVTCLELVPYCFQNLNINLFLLHVDRSLGLVSIQCGTKREHT